MGLLGKSEQERLSDTFDYYDEIHAAADKVALLHKWVYDDGPFQSSTISDALSLGYGVFSRHGTSKDSRRAIRATILARLAIDTPASPAGVSSSASSWKTQYTPMAETLLRTQINTFLGRLTAPAKVVPSKPIGAAPTNYGVTLGNLGAVKAGLTAPAPKVLGTPPPVSPGGTGTLNQKKSFFESVSRVHVILSGHGSWVYDTSINSWPFATLGPHQVIRFYTDHYYPLGNDAGQLVDNHRFPAPKEEFGPGGQVCDYTLHHKDKLVLLNRSGANGDQHFITVDRDTRLSHFLKDGRFSAATFHWAACRVVFNHAGLVECPVHHTWEPFASACVLQ